MIKLQNIRSYLLDEQFKITIINNNIDIVNFTSIGHFDDTKIIVRYNNGSVVVKGEKLVVKKLLIDEILIGGKIKSIELINI